MFVPSSVILTDVELQFQVDDGARVMVINSNFPNGAPLVVNRPTAPGSFMYLNQNQQTQNLASVFVTGELNRIVVTQIDDCIDENAFSGVVSVLNGVEVTNVTFPPQVTFNYVTDPSIQIGESTNLIIEIGNNNSLPINAATMTHLIPSALGIVPGTFTSLPGCPVLTASASSIVMASTTLQPMLSCTYTFSVSGRAAGIVSEFIAVTSQNAAPGISNLDILSVTGPPAVTKAYSMSPVSGLVTVQLTITVENTNTIDMLATEFTDNLPSGLTALALVSTQTIPVSSTCPTITVMPNAIAMPAETLPTMTRCVYVIDVQASGTTTNIVTVMSSNSPTGESASAVLTRSDSPEVTLAFGDASIVSGGSTSVTLTILGLGTPGGFTYTLPPGLTSISAITQPPDPTCPQVSQDGVTIFYDDTNPFPSLVTCSYTGTVTSTTPGPTRSGFLLNTDPSAAVANVPLFVTAPPAVSVQYGPSVIANGATSFLTIAVTNLNSISMTGVACTSSLVGQESQVTGPVIAGPGCLPATAATGSLVVSGGNIAAGTTCTYVIPVTGTVSGQFINSVMASSTNSGSGSGSASLDILDAPMVEKLYDQTSFPVGGSNTLIVRVTNPNSLAIQGVAFVDTFNPGIEATAVANPAGSVVGMDCLASLRTTALDTFEVSSGFIPANGVCEYRLPIVATAAGTNLNSVQVSSTNAPTVSDLDVAVFVLGDPVVTQVFLPSTIASGGSGVYELRIQNPNTATLLDGVYSGTFPANIDSATLSSTTGCGGGTASVSNSPLPVTFVISGADVSAASTCVFQFTYATDGLGAGPRTIASSTLLSSNAPAVASSSGLLTIMDSPVVGKTYADPGGIPVGASTILTLTIDNQNSQALGSVELAELFPAGLVAVPPVPNGIVQGSSNCPPMLVEGSRLTLVTFQLNTTVAFDAGPVSIPATTLCTYQVEVVGTLAGTLTNNIASVTSSNAPTGSIAQLLQVYSPPLLAKTYGASTIDANAGTTLTLSVENLNPFSMNGVTFNDDLSGLGLTVQTPFDGTGSPGTCPSVVITASSISLSSGTIPMATTCSWTVNVNGTESSWNEFSVTTNGAGSASVRTLLSITDGVTVDKSYNTSSGIATGATTVLTITVANLDTSPRTDISFVDSLPAQLRAQGVVSRSSSSCPAVTQSSTAITMAPGQTFPSSTTCVYTVTILGFSSGLSLNSISIPSTPAASVLNVALRVLDAPIIEKSYSRRSIRLNDPVRLTIAIENPFDAPLLNASFTDDLAARGLVPLSLATISPGGFCPDAIVTLTDVSVGPIDIPAQTRCVYILELNGTVAGRSDNIVALSSANALSVTATAPLDVLAAPILTKTYGASSIGLGNTTTMLISVENPNAFPIGFFSLSDSLPAELTIDPDNTGVVTACSPDSSSAVGNSIAVTFMDFPASTTCVFQVTVIGAVSGPSFNSATASSLNAPDGEVLLVPLDVLPLLDIFTQYVPDCVALGEQAVLNITLVNGGDATIDRIGFLAPLGIARGSGPATVSCAGSVSVPLNTQLVATNLVIPAFGSCTILLTVDTPTAGDAGLAPFFVYSSLQPSESIVAPLIVLDAAVVQMEYLQDSGPVGETQTLSISISNPSGVGDLTNVSFTHLLPVSVPILSVSQVPGTCQALVVVGQQIELVDATFAPGSTCIYNIVVQTPTGDTSVVNDPLIVTSKGPDSTPVVATYYIMNPPLITKSYADATVAQGGSSSLIITLENPNNFEMVSASFTDSLPMQLNAEPGTIAADDPVACPLELDAAATSVTFPGTSLPPLISCSWTIPIVGFISGNSSNIVVVDSSNAGNATSNVAVLFVVPAPVVAKSYADPVVLRGGSTTLTLTIQNTVGVDLQGVEFDDVFLEGLEVDSTTPITGTVVSGPGPCPSAQSTLPNSFTLAASTIPADTTCSWTVPVTATGTTTNLVEVLSLNAPLAESNNALLTVSDGAPVVTKTYAAQSIALLTGQETRLSINVTNVNNTDITMGFRDVLPAGLQFVPGSEAVIGSPCPPLIANATGLFVDPALFEVGATCIYEANVTGILQGLTRNTVLVETDVAPTSIGAVPLYVMSAPVVTKTYGTDSIAIGGATTTLSILVRNPNNFPMLGTTFNDILPVNLTFPSPGSVNPGSGCPIATATSSSLSLTGGTIPPLTSCLYVRQVSGLIEGATVNSVAVSSNNAPPQVSNIRPLYVMLAPLVSKSYPVDSFPVGDATVLTIVLENPNNFPMRRVSFVDAWPFGLEGDVPGQMIPPVTVTGTCTAGTLTVSIASGTVTDLEMAPLSQCSYSVSLRGVFGTETQNFLAAGARNAPTGELNATVNVFVIEALQLTQEYDRDSVALGGTATLNFIFNNSLNFFDYECASTQLVVPAGLEVVSGNIFFSDGNITSFSGPGIPFFNFSIPALNSTRVEVTVTGIATGNQVNAPFTTMSCNGPVSVSDTDNIFVMEPPNVTAAYVVPGIPVGSTTQKIITLDNSGNGYPIQVVGCSDMLPANVTITGVSVSTGCVPASFTTSTITLTGGEIPANGNFEFVNYLCNVF